MTAPSITSATPNNIIGTGFISDTVGVNMDSRWEFINNYNDSIGAINGTPTGTINNINGLWGAGLAFTSGSHLTFGNVYDQVTASTFSIGAVVKTPSSLPSTTAIITKAEVEGGSSNWLGYGMFIDVTTGAIFLVSGDAGAFHLVTGLGTTDLKDDAWHSLGLSWDGSDCRLYVDGVLENTVDVTSLVTISNSYQFSINSANNGTFNNAIEMAEAFFDETVWGASDFINFHEQTRHSVNNEKTPISITNSTNAVSI